MKRQITMLLCVLSALLSTATLPALAAETQYPISVEEYTYGPLDEPRINKVYQLSLSDDPSGIPTGDFERNGRHDYLLDLTRQDNVGVDTQLYTETITMDSDTGELSAILKKLDGAKEATTEDGYAGTLILDHTSVKVEVKGYQTTTRNLSAKRTYPSLSDADLSLIPKTITDNGRTLTLADVQWTSDGTYYTAAAEYTGTAASRSATGYTVTVNYTGKVAKTNCKVVTYTAIFGSRPLDGPEQTAAPDDTDTGSADWLALLGCGGGMAALGTAAYFAAKKIRERSGKK